MEKKTSRVVLVPCTEYDEENVYEAVKMGLHLLGDTSDWLSKEEKILLKPNLLKRAEISQAITTHPSVVKAVARFLQEEGYAYLSYGDSPGGTTSCEKAATGGGIAAAMKELGVPQADFEASEKVSYPKGTVAKEFLLCKGIVEADAIVNVCKMKTHALERITGAVKNMYGAIPGVTKGLGHVKFPDPDSFAGMLADLHGCLGVRLHIMDGIVAMDGNGPASGNPFDMGLLLFSTDPVALDSVFCRLVHLNPALVPTNRYGQNAGIGTYENIEVVTQEGILTIEEMVERFGHPEFDVMREETKRGSLKPVNFFLKRLQKRPAIQESKCVKCGICVESCPLTPKALSIDKEKHKIPVYDYNRCIRCYCCQEMCPKKAIEVKTPLLGKFFSGV